MDIPLNCITKQVERIISREAVTQVNYWSLKSGSKFFIDFLKGVLKLAGIMTHTESLLLPGHMVTSKSKDMVFLGSEGIHLY